MAVKCPECQSENTDTARYCSNCATSLMPSEEAPSIQTKTLETPKPSDKKMVADKYRILEELGRGGMGIVYKAKDIKLDRTVALKFLPAELTQDDDVRKRFIQEARTAAALNHPNIAVIHEIDEDENKTFIAMEYIGGKSLKEGIKSGLLTMEDAVNIITQVASGLQEAHEKEVIHRDIKPANIMLTEKGQAKIVDFGIAKLAGKVKLTRTGTTIGTVAYMSPEQAIGNEIDPRSDIWSLGVVLYEMLTRILPFKGNREQTMIYSILNADPVSPKKYREDLPDYMCAVIDRALQKDPSDRFQSADEFLSALKSPEPESKIRAGGEKHNLPVQLTSFIGREKEIEEIERLLDEHRFVTLTGAGGCGKTRLAIRVVSGFVSDFEDGVWFVELAPIAEPDLIPEAFAGILKVKEEPHRPLTETIISRWKEKNVLIVLDNCEHLVEACSRTAERLLQEVPGLNILATSREALNAPGEITWRVPSLSLPESDRIEDVEKLRENSEAVRLFEERAKAIQREFRLTEKSASAVLQICQRLDGIPLAIELAAARVRLLGLDDILKRLDERFQILAGGTRGTRERHKTLRAAIDWSYDLLESEEGVLFNRLAVFVGGFDMEAVEKVCTDQQLTEGCVLDLFASLVDKSLVVTETQTDGSIRYGLLETLRHYAREKLAKSGEEEVYRERHLAYYHGLAETAYSERLDETSMWLNRLETEHDNLRAALDEASSHPEKLLKLAGAMGWFWHAHSHFNAGNEYLSLALNKQKKHSFGVARALFALGLIQSWQRKFSEGLGAIEKSIQIWRELDEQQELVHVLSDVGVLKNALNDHEKGMKASEESVRIAEKLDDPKLICRSKTHLCFGFITQFQHEKAEPLVKKCMAQAVELKMPREIMDTKHYYGDCALERDESKEAERRYSDALKAALDYGDMWEAAAEMQGMAMGIAGQGRYKKALRLNGSALKKWEDIGATVPTVRFWDILMEKNIGRAKKELGEKAATEFENQGRHMDFDKAVAYALDFDKD
ncbi:MAG: protein kinase [Candidatus Aminicenantes bacterium]|nr:MAG: protein kinase [Candidatus Aminicenantes bacterium]